MNVARRRGQPGVDVVRTAREGTERDTCHALPRSVSGSLPEDPLGHPGPLGQHCLRAACVFPTGCRSGQGRRLHAGVDRAAPREHHRPPLVEPPCLVAGLVFKTSGAARERRSCGSIPLLYRSQQLAPRVADAHSKWREARPDPHLDEERSRARGRGGPARQQAQDEVRAVARGHRLGTSAAGRPRVPVRLGLRLEHARGRRRSPGRARALRGPESSRRGHPLSSLRRVGDGAEGRGG